MAHQVDYKPIAHDGAANVITQVQYEIDLDVGGPLEHGYEAGTAESAQVNKTLRQSSMMTSALANVVANALNQDLLDDGDLATLITKLTAALLGTAWTTGDVKTTIKTVADAGWVLMTDGTIGSAASTGTYANNDAEALFTLIWNNIANEDCPVVPGRGGSAAADWAANKKITLPKVLGRALAGSGAGAGLTARALGSTVGEENHVLTVAELASHQHVYTSCAPIADFRAGGGVQIQGNVPGQLTAAAGGDGGHNTMQPTTFVNYMIKL